MGCKCNGSCNNRLAGGDGGDKHDRTEYWIDFAALAIMACMTICAIAYVVMSWK